MKWQQTMVHTIEYHLANLSHIPAWSGLWLDDSSLDARVLSHHGLMAAAPRCLVRHIIYGREHIKAALHDGQPKFTRLISHHSICPQIVESIGQAQYVCITHVYTSHSQQCQRCTAIHVARSTSLECQ